MKSRGADEKSGLELLILDLLLNKYWLSKYMTITQLGIYSCRLWWQETGLGFFSQFIAEII